MQSWSTPRGRVGRLRSVAAAAALALAATACGTEAPEPSTAGGEASPDTVTPRVHQPAELTDAAQRILGFLEGRLDFDSTLFADTVVLYVSPEGGGGRSALAREQLRERSSWRVESGSGAVYPLTPPPTHTRMTTQVGSHLNCRIYPLASRYEELARLPHVGTMLEPPDGDTCLETWSLTVVFDPAVRTPTMVAAVYDQWEW